MNLSGHPLRGLAVAATPACGQASPDSPDPSPRPESPGLSPFERLTRQVARLDESGWRLARYAPPPSLPLAEVYFPSTGLRARAEILDLSVGGVRVAIDGGVSVLQGAHCEVTVVLSNGESHLLAGAVRWLQNHQLIIVFAITPAGPDA